MKDVKGLKINWESGKGDIDLPQKFINADSLFKADVLGDWSGLLTRAYHRALQQHSDDMRKISPLSDAEYYRSWPKEAHDQIDIILNIANQLEQINYGGREWATKAMIYDLRAAAHKLYYSVIRRDREEEKEK